MAQARPIVVLNMVFKGMEYMSYVLYAAALALVFASIPIYAVNALSGIALLYVACAVFMAAIASNIAASIGLHNIQVVEATRVVIPLLAVVCMAYTLAYPWMVEAVACLALCWAFMELAFRSDEQRITLALLGLAMCSTIMYAWTEGWQVPSLVLAAVATTVMYVYGYTVMLRKTGNIVGDVAWITYGFIPLIVTTIVWSLWAGSKIIVSQLAEPIFMMTTIGIYVGIFTITKLVYKRT